MKILLFVFSFLVTAITFGQVRDTDEIVIGKRNSTAPAVIKVRDGSGATDGYIKKEKGGDWLFSKDGTTEKKFGSGSGSGGGENYNNGFTDSDNPNAEEGLTGWTNSGGDFFLTSDASTWAGATPYTLGQKVVYQGVIYKANAAHTSTDFASDSANWDEVVNADALEGDRSFVWIPSAQNDYIESPLLDFNKDILKGKSCQSLIEYIGGDDNLSLKVLNGDGDVLSNEQLKAHGISGIESGWLLCPSKDAIASDSDKGNLRLRIENTGSSASPAIKFDKSYLGTLIGLSEMVLPDVFTVKINGSTETVIKDDGGYISSCSDEGATLTQCLFNVPFREAPTCLASIDDGSGTNSEHVRLSSVSVSGFYLEYSNSTKRNVNIICEKQGADAKQQVQVYKSVPKVTENVNEFSAVFSSNSVSSENIDFIDGNCISNGTGDYTCNYIPELSSTLMSCTATMRGVSSLNNPTVTLDNQTGYFRVRLYLSGSAANADWYVNCQKQQEEFKTPAVQPIVVGQVRNSHAETASKTVRVESCSINGSSGTPIFNSYGCNSWGETLTDGGTGNYTMNFKDGIFPKGADCFCSTQSGANINCISTQATSSLVQVYSYNAGGSTIDGVVKVLCIGEY